jgi:glutamate dehydrogenase
LSERFSDAISRHPLKREIIATYITNTVVNRAGATFVNFIASESGASAADVIRAFTLAREIFDLEPLWDQIDALDYKVDGRLQLDLLSKLIAITQRASRWMLRIRSQTSDMPTLIQRYQPAARELRSQLENWLPASAVATWARKRYAGAGGVESGLALDLSALEFIFPALDLVDLAASTQSDLESTARAYFGVDDELGLSGWRNQINRLPTDTLWQTQARGSARDDVYSIASQITRGLLSRQEAIADWRGRNEQAISRLNQLLATITAQAPDLAPVSVALRELRHLA